MTDIKKIKQDIRAKILRIANRNIAENDVNMLGNPYYLEPRDLVYLFMEVQEYYHINIPEEQLRNQQFATINGIATVIIRSLDKSEETG